MLFEEYKKLGKTFIVAEIGNNHEGNFDLAKKLITLASASGADAVKFQTFIPEKYVSNKLKDRIEILKSFQLSHDQFYKLSEFAKEQKIIFFSTPFDIDSAIFLNQIQPIFKVSSGDNNFYPLIDKICDFGKPIIISTGISDKKNINNLYHRVKNNWKTKKINSSLSLLHCVSAYPVTDNEANILAIPNLIKSYPDAIVGYSDHTLGNEAAISSVALGAVIIEKHFTIDNNFSNFRDHKLSANPDQFKNLVNSIRKLEKMKGNGELKIENCEKEISFHVRRSIASNKNLKKGQLISPDDITFVRPASGIKIEDSEMVIGKRTNKNISEGQIILNEDID